MPELVYWIVYAMASLMLFFLALFVVYLVARVAGAGIMRSINQYRDSRRL